jgi:class 3 adenylate cyclase
MLLGNLLDGLLIYGYFRFVDVTALSNYHGPGELAFFVISFGLLCAVGISIGRRWRRPLLEWARAPGRGDEARVRRLALTFPYAMASLTLAGWLLAGLAWGGIHTGRVLAGNIGSPDRLSWTLVGDPVNVASRLQGLNKDFGSDILLSGETARRLTVPASLEPLSSVAVKGKATAVEVYRAV